MVAAIRTTPGALFVGAGATAAPLPSGWQQNDIFVLIAETDNGAVTPPAGWAQMPNSPVIQTNAPTSRLHVWWKRATSSESNPTFPAPTDHVIGRIVAISGCPTTGDPWDVTASGTDDTTDTSGSVPGLTTTEINELIMGIVSSGFDNGTNVSSWYSAWVNTTIQSPTAEGVATERIDNAHTQGNGGTIGMATGFKPVAGTVNPTDVTVFTATTKTLYSAAFKSDHNAAFDVLTSGSSSNNVSPYTTLVVAAPANAKLYLGVEVSGAAVATPTITGLGLTWTLVDSQTVGGTGEKLAVYEAQVGGSAVSGALTITVSTTPSGCNWVLYKVMGHNQTGTTVQTVKTVVFATTVTLNFAAAANSLNRQIVFVAVSPQNTGNTITPEAGWVEGAEVVRSTPNDKLWAAHQPTAFDTSITVADDSSYDYAAIGLEINFVPAGGMSSVLGQPAEADTAQPLAKQKLRTVGEPSEIATAQPLGRRKVRTLGLPVDTSTALPLGRLKVDVLGLPSEQASVSPLGRSKQLALGQAAETDTAHALGRVSVRVLGQPVETDAPFALGTSRKSRILGQPSEADTALTLGSSKLRPLGQPSEVDSPHALAGGVKARVLGQPAETDDAIPLGATMFSQLGQPGDTSTALPLGRIKIRTLGLATETDAALPFGSAMTGPLGQPIEADTPHALGRRKVRVLGLPVDTSSAFALDRFKTHELGQPLETDTALPLFDLGNPDWGEGGAPTIGWPVSGPRLAVRAGGPRLRVAAGPPKIDTTGGAP